jgi:hypothetical protein
LAPSGPSTPTLTGTTLSSSSLCPTLPPAPSPHDHSPPSSVTAIRVSKAAPDHQHPRLPETLLRPHPYQRQPVGPVAHTQLAVLAPAAAPQRPVMRHHHIVCPAPAASMSTLPPASSPATSFGTSCSSSSSCSSWPTILWRCAEYCGAVWTGLSHGRSSPAHPRSSRGRPSCCQCASCRYGRDHRACR